MDEDDSSLYLLNRTSESTSFFADLITNRVVYFYTLSKWLNVILITAITILGLYGNSMSLRLFLNKFLNKKMQQKLTVYFLLLSLSDLLVLVLHYIDFTFRSWVNLVGAHSSEFNFVDKCLLCCKFMPYLRNVFRTVSVYTLLILTIQRFIILYFPIIRAKFLSSKFNEGLIVSLVFFALLLNMGNLFMNTLVQHKETGEFYCNVDVNYIDMQFYIDLVFISMTIIVPTVFIIIFSVILFSEIKKNIPSESRPYLTNLCHENNPVQFSSQEDSNLIIAKRGDGQPNYLEKLTFDTIENFSKSKSHSTSRHLSNQTNAAVPRSSVTKYKSKLNHTIRTTYMMVLLSKWFVILHVPYFISWVIYHIYMNKVYKSDHLAAQSSSSSSLLSTGGNVTAMTTSNEEAAKLDYDPNTILTIKGFLNLFEILFLFNYSVHFFLYLFNIPSFRRAHSQEVHRFFKTIWGYMSCKDLRQSIDADLE